MFILNKNQFIKFDIQKSKRFIDCWNEYYPPDKTKVFNSNEVINYRKELNIGKKLTEVNLKRLLRWKDSRRLTEKILSGPKIGNKNEKVGKVIKKLKVINDFRFDKISESEFIKETKEVFSTGIVWQVFLFHIARPSEYPIADQNVFLAFSTQKKKVIPKDWKGYIGYKDYFFEISISAKIINRKPKWNECNEGIVSKLKKVDNALFAFGKFLSSYKIMTDIIIIHGTGGAVRKVIGFHGWNLNSKN